METPPPPQAPSTVVLEERPNGEYVPTLEEVVEYARLIGIDPDREPELLSIAQEGIQASLPLDWVACQTPTEDIYYFHRSSGVSQWEHPADDTYRHRVDQVRTHLHSSSQAEETTTTQHHDLPFPIRRPASLNKRDPQLVSRAVQTVCIRGNILRDTQSQLGQLKNRVTRELLVAANLPGSEAIAEDYHRRRRALEAECEANLAQVHAECLAAVQQEKEACRRALDKMRLRFREIRRAEMREFFHGLDRAKHFLLTNSAANQQKKEPLATSSPTTASHNTNKKVSNPSLDADLIDQKQSFDSNSNCQEACFIRSEKRRSSSSLNERENRILSLRNPIGDCSSSTIGQLETECDWLDCRLTELKLLYRQLRHRQAAIHDSLSQALATAIYPQKPMDLRSSLETTRRSDDGYCSFSPTEEAPLILPETSQSRFNEESLDAFLARIRLNRPT